MPRQLPAEFYEEPARRLDHPPVLYWKLMEESSEPVNHKQASGNAGRSKAAESEFIEIPQIPQLE